MGRGRSQGAAPRLLRWSRLGWVESRLGWVDSGVLPAATAVACLTPGWDETCGRALAVPGGGSARRGVGGWPASGPSGVARDPPPWLRRAPPLIAQCLACAGNVHGLGLRSAVQPAVVLPAVEVDSPWPCLMKAARFPSGRSGRTIIIRLIIPPRVNPTPQWADSRPTPP